MNSHLSGGRTGAGLFAYWRTGSYPASPLRGAGFLSAREVSIGACFGEGTYLNDWLVTEGYARIVG
jgi:hypothetical protein